MNMEAPALETHIQVLSPESQRVKELEAVIEANQKRIAQLEQQLRDDQIELQAISDEFERAFNEVERARKEVEHANNVKSAFLASMSHELRTPLNAIINFSKFLKKGVAGPINSEQEQLLSSIVESGQHLLNLINDVLDMSKIESGSLKLYVESGIDMRDIIETAIRYSEAMIIDKPVQLHKDIAETLPELVGDRKRLLQIMLNILSNACKFTEQGTIKVAARHDDKHIVISVEDTGPGIAPEDYDAVFTAFKQSESGLRQGGSGTGLGMPISQKLVQAHEGRIWFESQVGKGTTFFVELPLKSALQPQGKYENDQSALRGG